MQAEGKPGTHRFADRRSRVVAGFQVQFGWTFLVGMLGVELGRTLGLPSAMRGGKKLLDSAHSDFPIFRFSDFPELHVSVLCSATPYRTFRPLWDSDSISGVLVSPVAKVVTDVEVFSRR